MSTFTDLGDESFVSLTTYRRNGEAVSTPVWVARTTDGALVVTTGATSGKVKRIRNNPAVALRACNRTGTVAPGVQPAAGRADIIDDQPAAQAALAAKYGIQYKVVLLIERLRRSGSGRVIVRMTSD